MTRISRGEDLEAGDEHRQSKLLEIRHWVKYSFSPLMSSSHLQYSAALAIAALTLSALQANCSAAEAIPYTPPAGLVRTVADAVLRDTPKPPDFNWGEGVLLSGMIEAHRLTKDPRYLEFVQRFAEHWSDRGIGPLLSAKGYCGHWGPAFAMLELSDLTGQPKPLALADEVVDFMLHRATRTSDGGLDHFAGKPELWVDTLDMCCPVLVTKARLSHRPELQAEARHQLEIFARHLQDPATGLFYHQWSETTGRRTTNFWARGNGWVVLASLETLKNELPESAGAKPLRERLGKQLASIVRLQDPASGLWHTVLDAPDTYLETSASAMFLYGMVEGRRHKLIEPPSQACLEAAWRGLARQVDGTGQVVGISGGTGPSSREAYARIRTGSYNYGTGAFLMAARSWARAEAAASASPKPGS